NLEKEKAMMKFGRNPRRIMRSMPIQPFEEARYFIEDMIENSAQYYADQHYPKNLKIEAVLPVLEKFYKIKGYENLKAFLRKRREEKGVIRNFDCYNQFRG
ncbi:MAG: hypothetical protein GY751_14245, partial [Bacteroidetes bacterium]|nr:hypothetical protein [Bacteroidota bacterium]